MRVMRKCAGFPERRGKRHVVCVRTIEAKSSSILTLSFYRVLLHQRHFQSSGGIPKVAVVAGFQGFLSLSVGPSSREPHEQAYHDTAEKEQPTLSLRNAKAGRRKPQPTGPVGHSGTLSSSWPQPWTRRSTWKAGIPTRYPILLAPSPGVLA